MIQMLKLKKNILSIKQYKNSNKIIKSKWINIKSRNNSFNTIFNKNSISYKNKIGFLSYLRNKKKIKFFKIPKYIKRTK